MTEDVTAPSSNEYVELFEFAAISRIFRSEIVKQIQSTTRTTEFFVVGKMSGILVRFVILVG